MRLKLPPLLVVFAVTVTTLIGLPAASVEPPDASAAAFDFDDKTTHINYSLGYQIGGDFERQGVAMDAAAVVQGITDALAQTKPKMSPADMRQTLSELKRKVVIEQ